MSCFGLSPSESNSQGFFQQSAITLSNHTIKIHNRRHRDTDFATHTVVSVECNSLQTSQLRFDSYSLALRQKLTSWSRSREKHGEIFSCLSLSVYLWSLFLSLTVQLRLLFIIYLSVCSFITVPKRLDIQHSTPSSCSFIFSVKPFLEVCWM